MSEPVIIGDATLLAGDVREVLRGLEAESVQCCITSPPYWGLRAYGTAPQVWGGQEDCEHEWGEMLPEHHPGQVEQTKWKNAEAAGRGQTAKSGQWCARCGAWRGELGLEPTPELYVEHIVEVFREVHRVMRPDGTLWLNMGDSYAGSWGDSGHRPERDGTEGQQRPKTTEWFSRSGHPTSAPPTSRKLPGLKPKDLCEIPSDVVRALRVDGWWLRSRIPWLKRNPMPESARDRPTSAVEYVYLLTKAARYFYDYEAGKMSASGKSGGACFGKVEQDGPGSRRHGKAERAKYDSCRARRNSDWFFESWQGLYDEGDGPLAFIVNPAPFKGAHFAVFPPKLVEPMVKAGTSEKGCCPRCGKPWERVVDVGYRKNRPSAGDDPRSRDEDRLEAARGHGGWKGNNLLRDARTLGWRPGCECCGLPIIEDQPKKPSEKKDEPEAKFKARLAEYERRLADWRRRWKVFKPRYDVCETLPCTVLDPFSGAGTTCMVAAQLGRRAIGIDLSEKYNRMAARRIGKALKPATFVDEQAEADLPLLAWGESRTNDNENRGAKPDGWALIYIGLPFISCRRLRGESLKKT